MSYATQNLIPGEVIVHEGRVSRFIYIAPVIYIFFGYTLMSVGAGYGLPLGYSFIVVGLLLLLARFIQRNTTELSVTNKRIIGKRGFIERHSTDVRLGRVESIVINQGMLGRLFDFGDVGVIGSGGTPDYMKDIDSPLEIRSQFMSALEALGSGSEIEVTREQSNISFVESKSKKRSYPIIPLGILIILGATVHLITETKNKSGTNMDKSGPNNMQDMNVKNLSGFSSVDTEKGKINDRDNANSPEEDFSLVFDKTKFWTADWGNDIRAALSKAHCKDQALLSEGYEYRSYSSLPISKIPKSSHAWYTFDDRAVTVSGCWIHKGDGLAHFKMKRKKDGKIFEQDINLKDGSWEARPYEESE